MIKYNISNKSCEWLSQDLGVSIKIAGKKDNFLLLYDTGSDGYGHISMKDFYLLDMDSNTLQKISNFNAPST